MDRESHEPETELTPALSEACAEPVEAVEGAASALSDADGLPAYRKDGRTPFARRLFLEVLSETGRVSRACEYAQLSVSSAYALRNRDPLFAASWDAACELARTALADALYERALDGTTETITRNGEVIAERHRHDSRLSVAVLHRLDKRCDRAADFGSRHVRIIEKWDEWLRLVGKGAQSEAAALLEAPRSETSPDLQLPQLALSANPTSDAEEPKEIDLSDRCWTDDDGVWMTDFAPPEGFHLYQKGKWGSYGHERECARGGGSARGGRGRRQRAGAGRRGKPARRLVRLAQGRGRSGERSGLTGALARRLSASGSVGTIAPPRPPAAPPPGRGARPSPRP